MVGEPMKELDSFVMKHQILMNWCWAAVSVSVARYTRGNAAPTECALASTCLSHFNHKALSCCDDHKPCNKDFFLERALDTVGQLSHVTAGPLDFDAIKSEIDAGRPVCLRVEWAKEKTGHFLAITGYQTTPAGRQVVFTDDPFYGKARTEYHVFLTKYQGEGTWTHTYHLKGKV